MSSFTLLDYYGYTGQFEKMLPLYLSQVNRGANAIEIFNYPLPIEKKYSLIRKIAQNGIRTYISMCNIHCIIYMDITLLKLYFKFVKISTSTIVESLKLIPLKYVIHLCKTIENIDVISAMVICCYNTIYKNEAIQCARLLNYAYDIDIKYILGAEYWDTENFTKHEIYEFMQHAITNNDKKALLCILPYVKRIYANHHNPFVLQTVVEYCENTHNFNKLTDWFKFNNRIFLSILFESTTFSKELQDYVYKILSISHRRMFMKKYPDYTIQSVDDKKSSTIINDDTNSDLNFLLNYEEIDD